MFDDLLLIDSRGAGYRVHGASKLHSVGPFWGYNIFLNQKLRVRLNFTEGPIKISLEDVKELIERSFKRWSGWPSRGDFKVLRKRVSAATSFRVLAEILV